MEAAGMENTLRKFGSGGEKGKEAKTPEARVLKWHLRRNLL
jgi:hypothetical protein